MAFTDWRSNKALLDRTLKKLTDLSFTVTNVEDQPLLASRKLKRVPPYDYTVILAFPETYPLHNIRAHLQSQELLNEYIRRPIKHLAPSAMVSLKERFRDGILEVCIRGPWDTRDYTEPEKAYEAVDEWVKDYALGEQFPEDFDFPEATFFSPVSAERLFVDSFFLEQPYIRPGSKSFGTFSISFGGRPLLGVLTSVRDWAASSSPSSALAVAMTYDLPESERVCRNLMGGDVEFAIPGFWQSCDVPPSRLAIDQNVFVLSPELAEFARKELIKPKAGMFIVGFFFTIFGRPSCIFMVANTDKPTIDSTLKSSYYIKPHILSQSEMYVRYGASINLLKLRDVSITLIGAGAIGSQAGLLLGRMGFQQFTVIDREMLTVGNVMRHASFVADVGQAKSEIAARLISAANPYVKVTHVNGDVTKPDFDVSSLANSLVVSTIADDRAEQYLNQKFCDMRVTAVYGRTTTTSYACRVIRIRPGTDACLKCLEYYSRFRDYRYVQLQDEVISRQDLIFQGCTAPSFLGANVDIGTYAHLVARIAFLVTGAGDQRWFPDLNGNHFILASRVVASEPKLMDPFTLRKEFFFPFAGCPHCGKNKLPYRCVVIVKEALEKMRALSRDCDDTETGGVLIGTVAKSEHGQHVLVVAHATRPGPRAVRKRAYFDRDTKYCGDLVKRFHSATGGDLNYVGEWHSHPSKDTTPSPLDNASLYEVVRDPGYKIPSPVSIIQSAVDVANARATIYSKDGTQYDESLIVTPFAELKILFPKFVEDLDPYPVVPPKEDSLCQREKRSLLSTLKQLWT